MSELISEPQEATPNASPKVSHQREYLVVFPDNTMSLVNNEELKAAAKTMLKAFHVAYKVTPVLSIITRKQKTLQEKFLGMQCLYNKNIVPIEDLLLVPNGGDVRILKSIEVKNPLWVFTKSTSKSIVVIYTKIGEGGFYHKIVTGKDPLEPGKVHGVYPVEGNFKYCVPEGKVQMPEFDDEKYLYATSGYMLVYGDIKEDAPKEYRKDEILVLGSEIKFGIV